MHSEMLWMTLLPLLMSQWYLQNTNIDSILLSMHKLVWVVVVTKILIPQERLAKMDSLQKMLLHPLQFSWRWHSMILSYPVDCPFDPDSQRSFNAASHVWFWIHSNLMTIILQHLILVWSVESCRSISRQVSLLMHIIVRNGDSTPWGGWQFQMNGVLLCGQSY